MANIITVFMPDWKVNLVRPVVLGFSGENKRATLIIKSNVVDPDTAYYLDVLSNGTKNTIALTVADSTLSVELTSDMLGYSGRKQMQIRAVKNETVIKSNIFNGEVLDSINASEDFKRTYPTVYDQYELQLSELNRLIEEVEHLEPGSGGGSGTPGIDGKDGKSAYELAVENGFNGSLSEWLASLKGAKGDKGDSGVEQQIVVENAVTAYTIKPNILYVFPELSQLDISFDLTNLNPNIVNDFHFQFANGSTPCELNLPENVNIGDYEPLANGVCEISIVNGLLSFQNWSNE